MRPQKLYKQKLASFSLLRKSRCFKTVNIKFFPQILSTEASFYILRPLTETKCRLNGT